MLIEQRKKIFLHAYRTGVGHLASCFSCVEILCALYGHVMRPDDKFVLSKGHAALALYVTLAEHGYFDERDIVHYGGEPNTLETPGVEASTGSLGHGLSIALGMALALKADDKPNRVYCLVGDGECQEGSIWEAVISAPAFKLNNLVCIIDNNHIQKMDTIKNIVGLDALGTQFESFGWAVQTVNGHDVAALSAALDAQRTPDKPLCVLAETVKGKGLSLMENNPAWHWRMPNKKEMKTFCAELGISETELAAAKGVR
jgi:transketolase